MGLHMLRKSIAYIPQSPFLIQGTIRENLDPSRRFTDDELWEYLEDVRMKETIKKMDRELLTEITESGNLFSIGQKQLICLCRAMLVKTKLVVLDEATANVDLQTDNFISTQIREQFIEKHKATVILIAHRLATVIDADRILVMGDGERLEYDHPFRLLTKTDDDKTITSDSNFAQMIKASGEETAM